MSTDGDFIKRVYTDLGTLVFDIEADALLRTVTKVHCYGSARPCDMTVKMYRGVDCMVDLEHAKYLIGHNIIGYDIPAIKKITGDFEPFGMVIDTMVLAKLAYPHLWSLDAARKPRGLSPRQWGSHSLRAWGIRLGVHKGDYNGGFEKWSQEMEDYCEQDVRVTCALLEHLSKVHLPEMAVDIEMRTQEIVQSMERKGVMLDVPAAQKLLAVLEDERARIHLELQEVFPPIKPKLVGIYENQRARAIRELTQKGEYIRTAHDETEDEWLIRHRVWLESRDIKFKRTKRIEFNPNSGDQIAARLTALGWEPLEFTNTGKPKTDDKALKQVARQFEEAKPLARYAMLVKRVGQIANPGTKNGWLDHVTDEGRIHGRFDTMGCISYRFAHSRPNLGQVPANRKPFGKECRSCFIVPDDKVLVGCDASGLELRFLGHYMAPYDGGKFAEAAAFGSKDEGTDAHTLNQKAAGLPDRDTAKTFIYAFIYGAGDTKLGSIIAPAERNRKALTAIGRRARAKFLRRTPALKMLQDGVRDRAGKYHKLKGLDGRMLHVRSVHSSVNLLLQSAGAIAVKLATCIFRDLMEEAGHLMGDRWSLVLHVHDEWQTECDKELADDAARLSIQAIEQAGQALDLRVPLSGEAAIGRDWSETH